MKTPPEFLHGTRFLNNLKDDVDLGDGVIYLDEPIRSVDSLRQSGYLEEKYLLSLFFGKKGAIDNTPEQVQTIVQACREMRREFIYRLQQRDETKAIENINSVDVYQLFDAHLSGVLITFDLVVNYSPNNCFDT